MPQVCGTGNDVKYGFAPLDKLGPDEIDDLATPAIHGATGQMNEFGNMEKLVVMKRVVLGDDDLTIAQRIHGETASGMKKSFGTTQGETNYHARANEGLQQDPRKLATMYVVAKSLRDLHFAPRKQKKYDLVSVLDFLLEKGMPVTDEDYKAAGVRNSETPNVKKAGAIPFVERP